MRSPTPIPLVALSTVLLALLLAGCEPTEQENAKTLGNDLRLLYNTWTNQGRPAKFDVAKYVYMTSHSGDPTNAYYACTNNITVQGSLYRCLFAVRNDNRFYKPGIVAIADGGTLLWVGDDGKIVVAPDTKPWSSKSETP
jgi:hypothetical protein